ncbi:MAG: hypothetical protein IT447_13890 [Phycisphaerales bacterium]|nr:hypothetical protein [Phycisphaerales bacterium]
MSALTKLFVVLLVVCSMLLTASVVVFVNKVENFAQTNKQLDAQLSEARRLKEQAQADLSASNVRAEEAIAQASRQIGDKNTQINALQQKVAEQGVQVADLSSKVQLQALALTQATEGQKAAQDMAGRLHDQTGTLRTTLDQLTKNNSDLNATVSDLTNKLEVTTRDLRFTREQLTEAQNKSEKLAAKVRDLGGNPSQLASAGTKAGAPAINGVVRDVRTIEGVPYATISVGSSDNVTKGMQFNVIDRDHGVFLGILTVDTVEPNESLGRLEGPRTGDIRTGSEVRTQL